MSSVRYTDWQVSKKHAELIKSNWDCAQRIELRKFIDGVEGKAIGPQLKAGIWVKPLGSQFHITFSSVQDVVHSSLVIFASGSSTAQSKDTPDYDSFRRLIYDLFMNRRGTGMNGEVYSTVESGDYDVDEKLARSMDVDVLKINSKFREDRIECYD